MTEARIVGIGTDKYDKDVEVGDIVAVATKSHGYAYQRIARITEMTCTTMMRNMYMGPGSEPRYERRPFNRYTFSYEILTATPGHASVSHVKSNSRLAKIKLAEDMYFGTELIRA